MLEKRITFVHTCLQVNWEQKPSLVLPFPLHPPSNMTHSWKIQTSPREREGDQKGKVVKRKNHTPPWLVFEAIWSKLRMG